MRICFLLVHSFLNTIIDVPVSKKYELAVRQRFMNNNTLFCPLSQKILRTISLLLIVYLLVFCFECYA